MLWASLKLLWKFYYADWKKRKLRYKLLNPIATFFLILFLFCFLSYYVVMAYYTTAPFQHATYDVELLNASAHQMEQISQYDYVETFMGYVRINGVTLEHQGNTVTVDFRAFQSETLLELDATPWNERLVVQRDMEIMGDAQQNPMTLPETLAKQLNVWVGDVVQATVGSMKLRYTVAGIYNSATYYIAGPDIVCVVLQEDLLSWIQRIDAQDSGFESNRNIVTTDAYVTFRDRKKGKELLENYIADIDLYSKYGENWREIASEEEINFYKGIYNTRQEELQSHKDNSADRYSNMVWLIGLAALALTLFIFWERNKVIAPTLQSLTVLVAEGCGKIGVFAYFSVATFFKQLWYVLLTVPVIVYPFMQLISREYHIYHFSGFLLLQCLPFVLGLLLTISLLIGGYLYGKFTRKMVLFTGEE